MTSLRNKIIEYLQSKWPEVIHKGELGRIAVNDWGYENENMGRRCRELEEEGIIKRIYDQKGRAMYQYIPTVKVEIKREEKEPQRLFGVEESPRETSVIF